MKAFVSEFLQGRGGATKHGDVTPTVQLSRTDEGMNETRKTLLQGLAYARRLMKRKSRQPEAVQYGRHSATEYEQAQRLSCWMQK